MKNDFRIIADAAYNWDAQPRNYLHFNGRVLRKYGIEYIKMKLSKDGVIYDDTLYNDQVRLRNQLDEALNSRPVSTMDPNEKIIDMEIPADKYDAWLNSMPEVYFDEYRTRKFLLDQYLDTFNISDKSRIIKIMCENLGTLNYVQFLDMDPNTMTTQQYLIYKDIIRFYDQLNLNDFLSKEDLWDNYNERYDAMLDNKTPSQSIDEEIVEEEEISDRLNKILSNPEETDDSIELLKQKIEELSDSAQQAMNESRNMMSSYNNQYAQQQVAKPANLVFVPPTINQPARTTSYNYVNTYGSIAKVGYANNIQDLIEQRNATAVANSQLVDRIIQNQLSYNTQFSNHVHNINGLQNTSESIHSIFNTPKQSMSVSTPINNQQNTQVYKSTMNFNGEANLSGNVFNSASIQNKPNITNDGIVKPVLIKKPMMQNNATNQQTQQTTPIQLNKMNTTMSRPVHNSSINMPNRSFNVQQPIAQKKTVLIGPSKNAIQSEPNSKINLNMNNKPKGQDIVSVYKVNTFTEETQPQRVMAGIPSKKID